MEHSQDTLKSVASDEVNSIADDAFKQVEALTRREMKQLLSNVQRWLYLDHDESGKPFWNPEKQWDCVDACQDIAAMLDERGLVPHEPRPFSPDRSTEMLAQLAELAGIGPEDLSKRIERQARSNGASVSDQGLDSQLAYLRNQVGESKVLEVVLDVAKSKNTEGSEA